MSSLTGCAVATFAWGDPVLRDHGIAVTAGAAAGYVPDAVCADCHQDKAESFAEVGMAKSFYRPSADNVIEDFDNAYYYHEPSNRHYEMELRGGDYWFSRYQLNAMGDRIHQFEVKVDWILGSGHHSRVYIYRTAGGELYQLPLSWYSQHGGKWEMAPGYEFEDHPGVMRLVRRRCMACHNALPDVPAGSDRIGLPETFPEHLPEGIGCQRCHGPGAQHVSLVLDGEAELDAIRAAIVQPGKLERDRLYSICYGCHMQPSVAVMPHLRPGRGVYSFRPGQQLEDYQLYLEIDDLLRAKSERFEINHHPYRLEQSACFTQSQGALGCLTCHDPHRKVPVPERAAHYRQACLSCHEVDGTGAPLMQAGGSHPVVRPEEGCTSCHMPERRTQDVIHVTMTDHRITRDPGPLQDLVAPIAKKPADVVGVSLLYPDRDPGADETLLAVTGGILEHTGYAADYASDAMGRVLASRDPGHYEHWLTLARAYFGQGRFADAVEVADRGLALAPDVMMLNVTKALALASAGDLEAGIAVLQETLGTYPDSVGAHYNLAVLQRAKGEHAAALRHLDIVATLNGFHWQGWRLRARILSETGDAEGAIAAYLQALAIAPDGAGLEAGLSAELHRVGRTSDAPVFRAAR